MVARSRPVQLPFASRFATSSNSPKPVSSRAILQSPTGSRPPLRPSRSYQQQQPEPLSPSPCHSPMSASKAILRSSLTRQQRPTTPPPPSPIAIRSPVPMMQPHKTPIRMPSPIRTKQSTPIRPMQSPRSPIRPAMVSPPPLSSSTSTGKIAPASSMYEYFQGKASRKVLYRLNDWVPMLQIMFLVVLVVLLVQSHVRATFASEQLLQFKEEESLMLLKLQKVERHSLQLHETISKRLLRAGIIEGDSEGDIEKLHPLTTQTSELKSMTKELHEQTEMLQYQLQDTAVKNIIEEYGEGAVKVILEIEFPNEIDEKANNRFYSLSQNQHSSSSSSSNNYDGSNHLSIVLWPDTPHAGWTWLEQIGRHVWDDAVLNWSLHHPVLEMTPGKADPLGRGHLDFIETEHNDENNHGAWTVGLRENDHGQLQMFLNMQDNSEYHQHEVCVGKVIGGFEALQRIVEATRDSQDISSIRIKKAHAVHVTNRELGLEDIWL